MMLTKAITLPAGACKDLFVTTVMLLKPAYRLPACQLPARLSILRLSS